MRKRCRSDCTSCRDFTQASQVCVCEVCGRWRRVEVWSSIVAMFQRGVSNGFYGPLGFCVWPVCCFLRSELFLSLPFPTGRRPP